MKWFVSDSAVMFCCNAAERLMVNRKYDREVKCYRNMWANDGCVGG